MTPLERAARDRLAQYSGVGFELPPIDLPPDMGSLTIAEIRQLMVEVEKVIREIIAPDLRLVLAALARHESIAGSVRETAQQVAEHAERFGPVPERLEITYQQPIPASALAWAREQAEQAAAKYEQWADLEANPALKTCMQFAARVVRAEFLGQDGDRDVNGRFTEAPAAQPPKAGE